MTVADGDTDLTRASRRFLASWRSQRLRDATGTVMTMTHFDPHEFWSATLEVLRCYRRSDLCRDSLMPHHGIPPVMVDELALLSEIGVGERFPPSEAER